MSFLPSFFFPFSFSLCFFLSPYPLSSSYQHYILLLLLLGIALFTCFFDGSRKGDRKARKQRQEIERND